VGEIAKEDCDKKMNPPIDISGMIFFTSDFLLKILLLFILFPFISP